MNSNFPEIPILFEDDDILILNKPAGMVVNRSQTHPGMTIQDWLEIKKTQDRWQAQNLSLEGVSNEFGSPEEIFAQRSGICHRLDKDTSGILICAKHPAALVLLMQQFKARTVKKTYLALTHGKMNPAKGEIRAPIGRHHLQRLKFAVREGGRDSLTEYQTLQYFSGVKEEEWLQVVRAKVEAESDRVKSSLRQSGLSGNFKRALKIYQGFSLLELTPHTGRTHQIRVHCAHVNHPLVGDQTYNGKKRQTLDMLWCARHFLHASSLQFKHPRTLRTIKIEASLPTDLTQVLSLLQVN